MEGLRSCATGRFVKDSVAERQCWFMAGHRSVILADLVGSDSVGLLMDTSGMNSIV